MITYTQLPPPPRYYSPQCRILSIHRASGRRVRRRRRLLHLDVGHRSGGKTTRKAAEHEFSFWRTPFCKRGLQEGRRVKGALQLLINRYG